MRPLNFALGIIVGSVFASVVAFAWTGPSSAPPSGNVSAPINVSSVDQEKQGLLRSYGFISNGSIGLLGPNRYLTFNSNGDSTGYGIRDNGGTMEFKDSAGSWQGLLGTSSTFTQIKFSDGSTQTTAPGTGGITAVTTASCTASCFSPGCTGSCVATCPATYSRTGCSSSKGGAQPSGSAGCTCSAGFGGPNANTCYAFCAK